MTPDFLAWLLPLVFTLAAFVLGRVSVHFVACKSEGVLESLLKDEQGSWSSARCSWWLVVLFTLAVCAVDLLTRLDAPGGVYAILTTLVMFTGGWAAGPRMAAYLFPQIGAAVKGVAESVGRRRGTDNARTDDERGE